MNKTNKHYLRKKLSYQSKNRGCKETDHIFSKYASEFLYTMSESKLQDYALILEQNDIDIYNWITAKSPVPPHLSIEILNELRSLNYKL